jgi:hypothetical protein
MAPPADTEKRGVGRLVDRGDTRMARRAHRSESRTVLRLGERDGNSLLTRSPEDIAIIARAEQELPTREVADMRSRLVRKVVEMEVLDASKGLARKEVAVQRDAAEGDSDKGKGTGTVFEKWYAELAGQGMSDREIEEHLAARVRGVRRGVAMLGDERRVGRR